jgi:hypothetical protein
VCVKQISLHDFIVVVPTGSLIWVNDEAHLLLDHWEQAMSNMTHLCHMGMPPQESVTTTQLFQDVGPVNIDPTHLVTGSLNFFCPTWC